MTGHPKLDIVRFEVTDFTKSSNKDMIPKFEELDRLREALKAEAKRC